MLKIEEAIPTNLQLVPVKLIDTGRREFPGIAGIREWSSKEAFFRGFRRSAKRIAIALLAMLPLAFIEPFLFMIGGGTVIAILVFVIGPYMHLRYWAEGVSFFYVESQCPYCSFVGRLTPYLSKAFAERFVVLCPSCGQTTRAYATLPPSPETMESKTDFS